jgi:CubicO group peptidase (beta-lactamase class C family)
MDIDSYLNLIVYRKVPSLTCSIFNLSNDDLYSKSLGYKCIENKYKADINTNYGIGSITKMFTAVSILQLCENKILNIEDEIYLYFKETPLYKIFRTSNIKILHLLSHTSGISNLSFSESKYNTLNYLSGINLKTNNQLYKYLEDIISFKKKVSGTEYNYLNIGYIILGLIIENVSNIKYKNYVNKYIINKLNLYSTYFAGDKQITNLAVPYIYNNLNSYEIGTQLYSKYPQAGGIVSNITDLKKLFISIFLKDKYSIINSKSLNTMTTLQKKVNYGYESYKTYVGSGLFINLKFNGTKLYFHNGGIMGGRANFSYLPDHKIGCIVLTNSDNYPAEEISKNLLSIFVNNKSINTIVELEKKLKLITGNYYSYKNNTKIRIYKKNNMYVLQFMYYKNNKSYTLYTLKYTRNIIYFNAINNLDTFQKNKCKILLNTKQIIFNQYLFNKSYE